MNRKAIGWLVIIASGVFITAMALGQMNHEVEQVSYKVVISSGVIEVRDYESMIVAETEIIGTRNEADNQGLSRISDYNFGNNSTAEKVALTTPIIQQPSEKITLNTPTKQLGEGNTWKVRFIMPASYTMATLPKPKSVTVKLKEIPARRFVTITFSGTASKESFSKYNAQLDAYIKENHLNVAALPTYAFF